MLLGLQLEIPLGWLDSGVLPLAFAVRLLLFLKSKCVFMLQDVAFVQRGFMLKRLLFFFFLARGSVY